jgi:membrane-associated phospholipid phosphatase
MVRRARIALGGAVAGVGLLALVWYVSHYVGFVERADVSVLRGFAQLNRPGVDRLTQFLATLCDPHQYVFLAAIPVIVALLRRRPRVAAMLAGVILCANETTQLLKPLLAAPRILVPWGPAEGWSSWPSGHATAAMSLALCAVIAAPARWRPHVAAVAAAFAVAVSYSFLELGWHYPSDVLGGFLIAAVWTLLGVFVLSLFEARRAPVAERPSARAAPVTLWQAFAPAGAMIAGAALLIGLLVLARPHGVVSYARAHEAFIVGASAIGALGVLLASGLTLMLRPRPEPPHR